MKKFLVTGGAGFIGSHIVEALVEDNNFVRVLDNFYSGNKNNLSRFIDKIDLIKGDIRSLEICIKAAKGMDFVLHQAALRSVTGSLSDPKSYNDVNIQGTHNLLEACLKNKIKLFVFASSSSVYGNSLVTPEKEEFLPAPISPYALSKLAGEHYCKIFSQSYGLDTVSLRYFNVYGPRQALDDQYSAVIPKFINCIIRDEPPPINGTGRQSRDFICVKDIVKANLLAVRNSSRLKYNGDIFNIANGRSFTLIELVDTLNKIAGKNIKPVFLKPRIGDVFKTRADLSKTKKILGFKPEVNFEDGLKLTVEYFRGKYKT